MQINVQAFVVEPLFIHQHLYHWNWGAGYDIIGVRIHADIDHWFLRKRKNCYLYMPLLAEPCRRLVVQKKEGKCHAHIFG